MEAQKKTPETRLFRSNVLNPKDEIEEKLEKCAGIVNSTISGLPDREAHDALNQTVCKSVQQHEDVSLGLLYIILTDPASAPKAYRDLSFITRDGLGMIINKVVGIVTDKFAKLQEATKTQILWLTTELVKNSVLGTENLCAALLRQIVGGDISPPNIWLAESMLNLLSNNRPWLEKNGLFLATALYCYLRLIQDHEAAPFKNLRTMEIEFCISLLRERFADCLPIGRDLVRLLQSVGRIPEFQALWKDILYKPQTLSPQFTGLTQLLRIRTSRKFLACRLTPDMENKIIFLTSKVKFGQQKRYQDWFHKLYLSSPESHTLKPDLIRYIVGVVHPSNEVLGSDVIPRWAIIGWLLTSCQASAASANAKLALFFDWMFFQTDKDNIMNIEPAILLMHCSIRSHPFITSTLLDFICRMMSNYCPSLDGFVRQGVRNGFRIIQRKKVVISLSPLLDNPKLERGLKVLVKRELEEFCVPGVKLEEASTDISLQSSSMMRLGGELGSMDTSKDIETEDSGVDDELEMPDEEALFSDPEEDEEMEGIKNEPIEKDYEFKPIVKEEDTRQGGGTSASTGEERESNEDITELEELENIGEELKSLLIQFSRESDPTMRCKRMENILTGVIDLEDSEVDDILKPLAVCLNFCLVDDLLISCFTKERNVEESLESPVYELFRNICTLPTHDVSRERFLSLLSALHEVNNKFGYRFLFYLKASESDEERLTMYEDFATTSRGEKSLQACLIEDLKVCQDYDPRAFRYIIPSIYRKFAEHVVGDSEILHMLVTNMEPIQLNTFICEITLGELIIFGEQKQLDTLIESTLDWESFEQYCVWQLIQAEDVLLESIVGILPLLKPEQHAEALANLLILMKSVQPSHDLLTPVLGMECPDKRPGNQFATALLRYWSQEYSSELAQLISQQVSKQLSGGKKRKNAKNQPSVDQVLSHLDWLHNICQEQEDISFFKQDNIRSALDQARIAGSEARKSRFKMLFSLCDEKETRKRTTRMSRQQAASKQSAASSDESDEEEESIKPKPTKRRKKTSTSVDSDSDD
ncbi:integrator complex subunit 3-like [Actinia tenebrosa]|uniref:Integrator complex subunit 3-like n=1 Tax=Actinia tenebrosa TaxID=6105 RepID=A0A6P8IET8_ACTTE|nr:integrator complex subunit 3-like [Actinia tenebrosa]